MEDWNRAGARLGQEPPLWADAASCGPRCSWALSVVCRLPPKMLGFFSPQVLTEQRDPLGDAALGRLGHPAQEERLSPEGSMGSRKPSRPAG